MDLSKYLSKVQAAIGKSSFTTMLSGLDLTITNEWVAEEHFMYGSSRLGVYRSNKILSKETFGVVAVDGYGNITEKNRLDSFVYVLRTDSFTRVLTQKNYELTNHLGNVLAVVSDRRTPTSAGGINIDYYEADVTNATLYYPFGMELKTYAADSGGYRFGYQGSEQDNEINGSGNNISTFYREYDTRLGRWLSVDPEAAAQPWLSDYVGMGNNPIYRNDPLGNIDDKPSKSNPNSTGNTNSSSVSQGAKTHIVGKLDNLGAIAEKYGTDVETLRALNPKTQQRAQADQVNVGEKLKLPSSEKQPIATSGNTTSQSTLQQPQNSDNTDKKAGYTPAPRNIPGFPDATRVKPKGDRTRWRLPGGDIFEWDGQHGELERYNPRGKHTGVFDPESGDQIGLPVPGRRIEPILSLPPSNWIPAPILKPIIIPPVPAPSEEAVITVGGVLTVIVIIVLLPVGL